MRPITGPAWNAGALQPLKGRRTRRLQTLFGTVEIEAPRFKVCRCRLTTPMADGVLFSPVCALLSARCTPELERNVSTTLIQLGLEFKLYYGRRFRVVKLGEPSGACGWPRAVGGSNRRRALGPAVT